MRNNLNLSIYKIYYDEIERGAKTVEYREIKPYYIGKLVDRTYYRGMDDDAITLALTSGRMPYKGTRVDTVTFFNGDRWMRLEVKGISVRDHHAYFAIRLGKVLGSGKKSNLNKVEP